MTASEGEPAGAVDDGPRTLGSRRGKRAVVVTVWAVTTAFVATVGWVAGANAGDAPVTLFGVVAVPNDPLSLAVAAVVVGNVSLVAVAAVVAVAARRDRERVGGVSRR